jgi:hypothetical protein
MEHLYQSKSRSCLALSVSLLLHISIILIISRSGIAQRHTYQTNELTDTEIFKAQKLISAGQELPATVLFQDEAPSGNDLIPSTAHTLTQPAQEAEQHIPYKTQAPLDKALEPAPDTALTTFAESTPTPQQPEQPNAVSMPQQQKMPLKQRRTANKKQITVSDISRGFIKSMQQEAGFNQASRDMKQLALQIYATKIWNIIKTAFLVGDNGLHLTENVSTHTHLILTIDRSGKLLNIHLDYPKQVTALRNIERLIISRAHQAGLFPPLPAQIPGTSKTFSFPLFIEGQKGFHAYSLGYQ